MINQSFIKIDKIKGAKSTMMEIKQVYPNYILDQIREMEGYLYLENQKRSFVPYNILTYNKLRTLAEKIIILSDIGTSEDTTSKPNNTNISPKNGEIKAISEINSGHQNADIHINKYGAQIEFNNSIFYVKIQYTKEDVKFMKSLKKTYWSDYHQKWVCKATISNLVRIQDRYNYFNSIAYDKIYEVLLHVEAPYKVSIYYMPQSMESVCVKIEGHRSNHEIIKRVSTRRYDKEHQRWIVPNETLIIKWIKDEYTADGAKIFDKLSKKGKNYKKVKNHIRIWLDNILNKLSSEKEEVIRLYSNALIATGYKPTTIRSYCTVMIKYIEAMGDKHVKDSTIQDYQAYITNLYDSGLSDSLINTYNSALKYCFKNVYINTDLIATDLLRPRKGRKLPKILSVGEIDRLLRATENVKHVTLLYTLYSSGLRLNEILSLQLTDMWWDRSQILVRGKGGKERVVIMADVLKSMLILYYEKYKPEFWLFEGQNNNVQYSESSVRKVIKKCAVKANIGKRATTHTLRHCFATHMMDNGVGIRYIQELLGHKDIKTTLIYTHVTNLEISKLQSPLDKLMNNNSDKA